jgi:hypothetical protein
MKLARMNVNKLKMGQVLPREVSVLTLLHFSKHVNMRHSKTFTYISGKLRQSSNIWEQHLQIKIVFMKRLRAD